ncbi:MAG: M67 family metallopeptidase [Fibromonadales bacterium]|nr:M67 family metallopeptidase [Fibromonadales bacterium]
MITVRMKQTDYEAIVAHARKGLPNEACGLIAGKNDGDVKIVEKVYLLSNPDSSPEHFSIDPREQLTAVKDMRANGIVPLGNFHSHPATPARLSEEDIRLAYDSKASYLILTLADDPPALKAFGVAGGEVSEQGLEVVVS